MILPNPSIQLEPGNKVVMFVHYLKEGLSAEQLADDRRMDEDTLAVAKWSRQPLHRKTIRTVDRHCGASEINDSHGTLHNNALALQVLNATKLHFCVVSLKTKTQ